jgi:hypothetical protein
VFAEAVPQEQGEAVQVDPMKRTLKAPVTKILKLRYDKLLSSVAFNFNLRSYNKEILVADTWAQKMLNLLDERDLGILTGVISLLTGIVAHDSRGYEACIPKVCAVMQRLARNKDIPQAGPYTHCSPRHGTATFSSRHEGSKCVACNRTALNSRHGGSKCDARHGTAFFSRHESLRCVARHGTTAFTSRHEGSKGVG